LYIRIYKIWKGGRKRKEAGKMIGIIIAAHGVMAPAALELAGMFLGEQERTECISFQPGDSLDVLMERFQAAIRTLGTEDGILVLTDLEGGSPCNVATLYQKTMKNIRVVYGFNIPMLLEVLDAREQTTDPDELAEAALQAGVRDMGRITVD